MNKVCPYCGHNRNMPWDPCCRRCGKGFSRSSAAPAWMKLLALAGILAGGYLLLVAKYGHRLPRAAAGPANGLLTRGAGLLESAKNKARLPLMRAFSKPQGNGPVSGAHAGMAYIPAGKFYMGAPEEAGVKNGCRSRQVWLAGFYIDVNDVTVSQYAECVSKGACPPVTNPMCNTANPMRGAYPADCVTWRGAAEYCAWRGKTLPSSAQWEKAARAGSESAYYFGADETQLHRNIWYDRNSDEHTQPAGLKQPNKYGLHDMQGQIKQWTLDWYDQSCAGAGAPKGKYKILRGCSAASDAEACRISRISKSAPDQADAATGFRCAR